MRFKKIVTVFCAAMLAASMLASVSAHAEDAKEDAVSSEVVDTVGPDVVAPNPDAGKAPKIYGDLDNDTTITSNDALLVLRASLNIDELTPELAYLADVDGDGLVTTNDALAILRYSLGFVDDNYTAQLFQNAVPEPSGANDEDEVKDIANPDPDSGKAPKIYGDLDNDTTITSNDALLVLRASLNIDELTPEQAYLADVDGDGLVTTNDALAILRYSLGFVDDNYTAKLFEMVVTAE